MSAKTQRMIKDFKQLHERAILQKDMNNKIGAIELFKKGLETKKCVLGDQHIDLTITLDQLGALYKELGRHSLYIETVKESIKIRKQQQGTEKRIAKDLDELSRVVYKTGDYDEAIELRYECVKLAKNVYEPNDIQYATYINNLAVML